MDKYQSTTVPFVSRQTSVRWSNQITPMNDQQYYRNNTNQWIPRVMGYKAGAPHLLATSGHPVQFQNSNAKDDDDNQRKSHFKVWLIFGGILHTVVTLTVLLMALYLLMITSKTSATTTTLTTTTTSTTTTDQPQLTQQPYYCSGVSSYTLWTLFGVVGITMDINTSNCSFNSTPLYFTSLAGIGNQWNIGGYTGIYYPTNVSFTIFAQPLTAYSSTLMLSNFQTYKWDVNWFGISD